MIAATVWFYARLIEAVVVAVAARAALLRLAHWGGPRGPSASGEGGVGGALLTRLGGAEESDSGLLEQVGAYLACKQRTCGMGRRWMEAGRGEGREGRGRWWMEGRDGERCNGGAGTANARLPPRLWKDRASGWCTDQSGRSWHCREWQRSPSPPSAGSPASAPLPTPAFGRLPAAARLCAKQGRRGPP